MTKTAKTSNGKWEREIPTVPSSARRAIRQKLLRWYDRLGRDLPWRRRRNDPYAQWVAEVMLQQTQVETVKTYYERFMKRFPDVPALARADEHELLMYWQGLGYYRRADHLHRAAKIIASDGGQIPNTTEELLKLPGIGRYTAGAIASIAFDRRAAAVDGNVVRVLTRLSGWSDASTPQRTLQRVWRLAESMIPAKRCGDFNQALMDLGATVCVTGRPRCEACPLKRECKSRNEFGDSNVAHQTKPVQRNSTVRPAVREVRRCVALLNRRGAMLMIKRPAGGLWGSLWEFPNVEADGDDSSRALRTLLHSMKCDMGRKLTRLGTVTHRLTHRLYTFNVFHLDWPTGHVHMRPTSQRAPWRWVSANQLRDWPMSTACRKMLLLTC